MLTQDWTGEADLSDALIATAHRLPQARFIITTLGKKGAVLLERGSEGAGVRCSSLVLSFIDVCVRRQCRLNQQCVVAEQSLSFLHKHDFSCFSSSVDTSCGCCNTGPSSSEASSQGQPLVEVLSQLEQQLQTLREQQVPKEGCVSKGGLQIR